MRSLTMLGAALTLAVTAATAHAQTTQSVTLEVQAINQMSVSGTPSLTVSTATAGSAPTAASQAVTWAVTTNETNKKITAAIDLALPSGVTLRATLGAPTGATSAGAVSLGTVASDIVTAITKLNESGLSLNYELSATSAAGTMASTTRTVTYTIVSGA